MPVNHQRVLQIIHRVLRSSRGNTLVARMENAQEIIMAIRNNNDQTGNCNDMDLVAVDHYIEGRLDVVRFGMLYPLGVMCAGFSNSIYEVIKGLLSVTGQRDLMREGNCPVSPSSLDVIRWARAGARNGFRDCRTHATAQNFQFPDMSDISATELHGW